MNLYESKVEAIFERQTFTSSKVWQHDDDKVDKCNKKCKLNTIKRNFD